jgi:TRAP-type mannitol/chloroaromatic compound transport system substrate-binding protein
MANDERVPDSVNRRGFVGAALASTAGLVACGTPGDAQGGAAAVRTQSNVQWRLVSSFPRSLDTLYGASERLAEKLEALTEGRFRIRPYPAGELVPAFGVMDAAQQGTVQVGHTASYYFTGKNPVLAFDTGLPFGFNSRLQDAWLYEGGGLDLIHEAYADFNIITFPAGNTGAQMGGWFRREINTAADLRGLKMRIPALGGEVMDRLGVSVQVLAGGEIFPALERGAIDATEWVGPYDDEKLGFHNVAPYYYYPGWWEPGPSMSFQVNRTAWDQLPVSYQEAFRAAALYAANGTMTSYDAKNPEALRRLVDGGVQLRRFSPEIMHAAREAAFSIVDQYASADAGYRKVYDAWRTFRDDAFRWFSTSEQAYANFTFDDPQRSNA